VALDRLVKAPVQHARGRRNGAHFMFPRPRKYVWSGMGRIPRTSWGATYPRIARSRSSRLVDPLAHTAEGALLTLTSDRGRPAVDLQLFEAVVAHPSAERPLGRRATIPPVWPGLPNLARAPLVYS
jgi:hypothetical protein